MEVLVKETEEVEEVLEPGARNFEEFKSWVEEVTIGTACIFPLKVGCRNLDDGKACLVMFLSGPNKEIANSDFVHGGPMAGFGENLGSLELRSDPILYGSVTRARMHGQIRSLAMRFAAHEVEEWIMVGGQRNPDWHPHPDGTGRMLPFSYDPKSLFEDEKGQDA